MSERNGVEIDYCPTCRGVWLDRGELDKILERAAADFDRGSKQPDRRRDDDDDWRFGKDKKKRKSSFLGEIFDFG